MGTEKSVLGEYHFSLRSFEPGTIKTPNPLRRALLLVMKFLSATELLVLDQVSKEWRHCSIDNEVWRKHLVDPSEASADVSIKDICKRQLRRGNFFAHIQEDRLTLFTISPQSITTSTIPAPFKRSMNAAWISTQKHVLYCGGVRNGEGFVADNYLIDVKTLVVEKLTNMITRRSCGALVYRAGKVYMFGGAGTDSGPSIYGFVNLKQCEKYNFRKNTWTALPDMQCARRSFTPALWKDQVFIAGGGGANEDVEIFSLVTETFTLADFQLPLTETLASLFVIDGQLLALSNSQLYSIPLSEGVREKPRVKHIDKNYWYSPGGCFQKENVIYFGASYKERLYSVDSAMRISVLN